MIVIDEDLLDRFRGPGRCENCWRWCRRQAHHLTCRGMGGGTRLDVSLNIMGVCPACHRRHHDGKIHRDRFFEIVARRQGLTVEELRQQLADLRRA